jgi:hypothetical protein
MPARYLRGRDLPAVALLLSGLTVRWFLAFWAFPPSTRGNRAQDGADEYALTATAR